MLPMVPPGKSDLIQLLTDFKYETCIKAILILGGFSEIWHQSFKLEKKSSNFFLKTSLVHLGGSPDTIGKVSWPLKEAILEAKTFVLNLDKFEWKLQGALETSIFIRYASVIPFWKPLGVLMKLCTIWLTSEVIRGHQRPLKMKKMGLITFFDQVWQTPNFKLKPSEHYVGYPWKKISWMRPGRHFFWC